MALLRYLQLPDPTGPLSSSLPSSAINEANASARQEEATKTREGLIVTTNATLFLHTSPSDLELYTRFAKMKR